MKLYELEIDFPEIEGTERQIWYAGNLREAYVYNNYERFKEIEKVVNTEADMRIRNSDDAYSYSPDCGFDTFKMEFSDEEMCCLYSSNAGAIIGTLKEQYYTSWE